MKTWKLGLLLSAFVSAEAHAFPDSITCYVDDPLKPGYTRQTIEIKFPHISSAKPGRVSGSVVVSIFGEMEQRFEKVDLDLEMRELGVINGRLYMGTDRVEASIDQKPLFSIETQKPGISLIHSYGVDRSLLLAESTSEACLYLDGTIYKGEGGISGSN
jgi:hypothetical protein